MRLVLAGILTSALWLAPPLLGAAPVAAQVDSREGIALQNQILELKRDMQTLRDQVGRGASGSSSTLGGSRSSGSAPAGNDLTAALLDRVTRLEDQVRSLRGRIDEADNARQQQNAELSKRIDDLNFRLENGTAGTRPAAVAPPAPPPAPGAPPVPPPPQGPTRRTPEMALQEGNAALARRDYATAESAAREVLAGAKTPRSTDAQFLLAEALSGKKDYQGAAVAYDDAYNRSRTGARAPDSLLGLANALNAIGEKRAACATLDKLRAEFPSTRQDLKDPIAAARQKAACR